MGAAIMEIRRETSRASRIHALLKIQSNAHTEIATLLREELDAVGEKQWLQWCKKEFGWKRAAAYNHLNPVLLVAARKRDNARNVHDRGHNQEETQQDSTQSEEPEDAPTVKQVARRDPLAKILLEMIPMIRKWPIKKVYQKMSQNYQKGVGYDETTVKALRIVQDWLGEYIKTMEQFIVSCST